MKTASFLAACVVLALFAGVTVWLACQAADQDYNNRQARLDSQVSPAQRQDIVGRWEK